eukprot:366554-Chlamydomonas_euryale.AAC.4
MEPLVFSFTPEALEATVDAIAARVGIHTSQVSVGARVGGGAEQGGQEEQRGGKLRAGKYAGEGGGVAKCRISEQAESQKGGGGGGRGAQRQSKDERNESTEKQRTGAGRECA